MTIIREGKLPELSPTIYWGECHNCHVVIECNENEFLNNDAEHAHVMCPTKGCNFFITMLKK